MSTVWIVKAAGHSFHEAQKYGDLKLIFDESDNSFNVDELCVTAHRQLRDYKPDDYLLLSGSLLLNCLAFTEVAKSQHRVNVLVYHAKLQVYMERTVSNV